MPAKKLPKLKPGAQWRVSARGKRVSWSATSREEPGRSRFAAPQILPGPTLVPDTVLDEVVIDSWLHVEMMDTRCWWVRIGTGDDALRLMVNIDKAGVAHLCPQS